LLGSKQIFPVDSEGAAEWSRPIGKWLVNGLGLFSQLQQMFAQDASLHSADGELLAVAQSRDIRSAWH
jgi:hypothetical protein